MQRRVIFIITIIWVVFTVVFAGGVWLFKNQEVIEQGYLKREVDNLVFWGEGQATVTVTHASRPNFACPPQRRATNVVLLLDKSGSMVEGDINAFGQAVAAAEAFVDVVDLGNSKIAIGLFDTQVTWINEFSQEPQTITQKLDDYEAGGKTDIAAALSVAREKLLAENATDEAEPTLILLSDGADDPESVLRTAAQLKEDGVRILTIALGLTESAQLDFLEGIATSPDDAYESVPTELRSIYESIAEEFNNTAASNVVYSERVNQDLVIVPNSQLPPGQQAENRLQWELTTMTKEGAAFSYVVSTTGWGRYPLNPEESHMSYIECVAGAVTLPLAAGPTLLVLPPLLPTALLGLLPLLFLVFLLFWRRKSDTEPLPSSSTLTQAESQRPEPVKFATPEWLKRLNNTAILAERQIVSSEAELTPTVIIGLGQAGRLVLNQVARILRGRYGKELPAPVRLLQIDIQPENAANLEWERPTYLLEDEWVLLVPNLEEMQYLLQKEGSSSRNYYLNWYEPYAPSGRMQGRMAVYYDLRRGSNGSALWSSLHKTVHELENPEVKIVGATFDDGSSGLLVDVARLTQIVIAGSNPDYSNIDVEMWLTTPVGEDWSPEITDGRRTIRQSEQQARTLATLRELERFQRNVRQPFIYVPDSNMQDQLRSTTNSAVVQTIFLFEPRPDMENVEDHLNTIADGLSATLHTPTQQELNQHLTATQRQAGTLVNRRSVGTACSLGAYAVRLPLGILDEAAAWRATYDLLFESLLGLQPCREQQPNGMYREVSAQQVVPDDGQRRRQTADELVEAFIRNLQSQGFMHAVANHVNDLLNGEFGPSDVQMRNRQGSLVQAQRWLESVRSLVQREGERDVARTITSLIDQVQAWQSFLQDDVEPLVAHHWQSARSWLGELIEQKGRQWILDDELEWALYRRHVRTSPGDYQILARAAKRFGWQVQYKDKTEEWQLDFLAPPLSFVWSDDAYLPEYVVEQEPEAIAQTVYHAASTLTRHNLYNETVLDNQVNVRQWLERAEPGFTQTYAGAQGLSSQEVILFVAPESRKADKLHASLESNAANLPVKLCPTKDTTAMTVLRVQGHMPLDTYAGYTDETWETAYVDPSLYVWRGEQVASRRESQGEGTGRLDAKFVGWLQLDQELLDLFCLAYIYGLWEQEGAEWYLPGLGRWPGESMGKALDNLFGSDSTKWPLPLQNPNPRLRAEARDELAEAVRKRQEEIAENEDVGGKRGYLRRVRKELVPPLTRSSDVREQNLALYLHGFLSEL